MLFPVPEQPPICAINRSSMSIDAPDLSERAVNRGFVLFVAVRTVGTLLDSAVLAALAPSPSVAHGGAR